MKWLVQHKRLISKQWMGMLFMVIALSLGACSKEDSSKRITARGGSRTSHADREDSVRSKESTQFPGAVVGSPQDLFQEAVDGLVSAVMNPLEEMGYVSGDAYANTGVRFGGRVEFSTALSMNGYNSGTVKSGQLDVLIWDSLAGRAAEDSDKKIPGILLDKFEAVSGSVSGNQVRIVFEDEHGAIELNGYFDQSYFQGQFDFENYTSWDGGGAAYGTLGSFYIPTCDFLRCQ